jgi:hypothetical protein
MVTTTRNRKEPKMSGYVYTKASLENLAVEIRKIGTPDAFQLAYKMEMASTYMGSLTSAVIEIKNV